MPILAQEIEAAIQPEAPFGALGFRGWASSACTWVQQSIVLDAVSPNRHRITGGTKPDTCTSPAC